MKNHLLICSLCGEYLSQHGVCFEIGAMVADKLFLPAGAAKNQDDIDRLKKHRFSLLVSFQDLLDSVCRETVAKGTYDADDQWNRVYLDYTSLKRLLKKAAGKVSIKARESFDKLFDEDEESENVSELFRALKWFKGEAIEETTAKSYRKNLLQNEKASMELRVFIKVDEEGAITEVRAKNTDNEEIPFERRCACCGEILPECYGNTKVSPVLLLGSQQCGKTSLASAVSVLAAGCTVNGKELTVAVEGPSRESEERAVYETNKNSFRHGYEVEKTDIDLRKAPISCMVAKHGKGESVVFPIVDLPGETVAKQKDGIWYSPLANGDDVKIHKIATRCEYVVLCLDSRTLNPGPDTCGYNFDVPPEVLLESLKAMLNRSHNAKKLFILVSAMDLYQNEGNAPDSEYQDFFNYWYSDVNLTGGEVNDGKKSLETILGSGKYNADTVSDLMRGVISRMSAGKEFLTAIDNANLPVPVSFLPCAPYGVTPYDYKQRKKEWTAEVEAAINGGDMSEKDREKLREFALAINKNDDVAKHINDFANFRWSDYGLSEVVNVRKSNKQTKKPLCVNFLLYSIIDNETKGKVFGSRKNTAN